MGSLNGDVVVMRNGRSTSQVSIYNYPEHLNPFYEEDQHKRLRFWKISKKDNEGRRNSFSIGNLKDMWAFKSFRMKKKSSTLGINKTSESPPPLRREYVADNGWNSFDHRLRGSTTSSIDGDSFQRNAGYRSSLQNLPSTNNRIGFNRNDDYRSTIQVPRPTPRLHHQQKPQVQPRRYVYGGSVTPQPLRNTNLIGDGPYQSNKNNATMTTRWGSSQSSMVSTNPFESDIEDDNEDVSAMQSVNGGSTSTLSKVAQRKKRRAPAPPTPIHGRSDRAVTPTIVIESSQDDVPNDLCIREDTDIANLTAEIESFVKDKNNDDIEALVLTKNKTSQAQMDTKVTKDHSDQTKIKTTTVITTTTTVPAAVTSDEATQSNNNFKQIEVETTSPPPKRVSVPEAASSTPASQKPMTAVERHEMINVEVNKVTSPTPAIVTKEVKPTDVKTETQSVQENSQTNGQAKTEKVVVKTTTTTISESPKRVNGQALTLSENHKDVMSNGAIPKQVNSAAISKPTTGVKNADVCIEESIEQPQKPLAAQRAPKSDNEVGHVECIHVHVESPRATPRENHANKVSSFKNETPEVITTKTPFILTSPPQQRKSQQNAESTKESASSVPNTSSTAPLELSIQEEPAKTKPEIIEKPALSPKPFIERNGKVHAFAEIHKPMRNKAVAHSSNTEIVTPPTVPGQQPEEQPHVVAKITAAAVTSVKVERPRQEDETKVAKANVNIDEASTAIDGQRNEMPSGTSQSPTTSVPNTRASNESLQFESLYRPQSHMEWKRSTLAPLETNIPPEKRKSVKDIIESINRSQRLLHASANKDFTIVTGPPSTCTSTYGDNSDDHLRILDESQREIRRMVQQINHLDGTSGVNTSNGPMSKAASPPPSYSECVAAEKLENNAVFQKCKVNKEVYDHRESSPISSNLDWNPVPKPKRTKPQNE